MPMGLHVSEVFAEAIHNQVAIKLLMSGLLD